MKKHSIALAVGMITLVVLASASSWEGSAMMGLYGDFPASGYYAACNSFPRNTSVEVTNMENGRSITAIVTKSMERSGIFMMLSVEAAQALGLESGSVARVRASEPKSAVELAPSVGSGSSYDPDLNPRLLAAQELKRLGYELEPTARVATISKPDVSSPRVEPSPATVPAPVSAEPVAAPISSPIETTTRESVSRAATPLSVVPVPPVAPSVGSEAPESLAAPKAKPVRTIVLPQLPEPSEPVSSVARVPAATSDGAPAESVPESSPEALTILLPEPDETPLRVESASIPKRYEAPSVRPEVSTGGLQVPVPPSLSVAMLDPLPVDDARAAAFARLLPEMYAATSNATLYDPSVPDSESAAVLDRIAPASVEQALAGTGDEYTLTDPMVSDSGRVDAFAKFTPQKALAGSLPELVWPELEADPIPEVLLSLLYAPAPEIPATSLVEGEMILPASSTGPSAITLETPAFGAAETVVALDDAETEAVENPTAESLSGITPSAAEGTYDLAEAEARGFEKPSTDGLVPGAPVDSADGVGLAEAMEQKPETSPLLSGPETETAPVVALDSPKEYIIAMEPAGPKPPVDTTIPAVVTTVSPATIAPAASIATVSTVLEKGRYYIQIGAYASETLAKDSAGRIKTGYAILIQKMGAEGKGTWRVYVGPLSRDESGVALVRVRAMGYKDAFVKSGS